MFCKPSAMFGFKNISNVLDCEQPTSTHTLDGVVVPPKSCNMTSSSSAADADDADGVKSSGDNDNDLLADKNAVTTLTTTTIENLQAIELDVEANKDPTPTTVSLSDSDEDFQVLASPRNANEGTEQLRLELATSRQAQADLQATVTTLTLTNKENALELEAAHAKQTKMRDNLKNKRALLSKANEQNVQLQSALDSEKTKHGMISDEADQLRLSLQSVMASRQDLKQKSKSHKESIKQARNDYESLERKMLKVEKMHLVENELIDHYRALSLHTGYFKWGKPIRTAEADLAAKLEAADKEEY